MTKWSPKAGAILNIGPWYEVLSFTLDGGSHSHAAWKQKGFFLSIYQKGDNKHAEDGYPQHLNLPYARTTLFDFCSRYGQFLIYG